MPGDTSVISSTQADVLFQIYGGMLRPGITEVYGDPDIGRTTLALQTAGLFKGEGVLYCDLENKLSPYLSRYVRNPDTFYVTSRQDPAFYLEVIDQVLPWIGLLILDGMEALEGAGRSVYEWQDLLLAKLNHEAKRALCTVLLLTQYRYDPALDAEVPLLGSWESRKGFVGQVELRTGLGNYITARRGGHTVKVTRHEFTAFLPPNRPSRRRKLWERHK